MQWIPVRKVQKGYKSNKTLSSNSYNCPNYPVLLYLDCSIEILNKWVKRLSFLSLFSIVSLVENILHMFNFESFASYGNQWCKEQYFYNSVMPNSIIGPTLCIRMINMTFCALYSKMLLLFCYGSFVSFIYSKLRFLWDTILENTSKNTCIDGSNSFYI